MRRTALVFLLSFALVLQGCAVQGAQGGASQPETSDSATAEASTADFSDLSDPDLQTYIEEQAYSSVVSSLDSDQYFVENVEAKYVSKEYLAELAYNSKENVYFGYSLSDLESNMNGTKYVFTLGDDGQTTVKSFEAYDDTYDQVVRNVAIGTGVILVCVTVSVVAPEVGAPAAVTAVFAVSAKTGAVAALSGGAIGGIMSGITTGIQTGDMKKATDAAALAASEGYMWGAICGAISGGVSETAGLFGASRNGLTMSEAATIQKETKYPLGVIKSMRSMDEAKLYEDAGLTAMKVGGKDALVQKVDWNLTDEFGRTNIQRVMENNLSDFRSPIGPDGEAFELHHIGQKVDSPFAILTKAQHRLGKSYGILHDNDSEGVHAILNNNDWKKEVQKFWIDLMKEDGVYPL